MDNKLVILLVISLSAFACNLTGQKQNKWSPKEMAEQQTKMMSDQLNLSEVQYTQVETVNLKYAEEFEKLREKAGGDREKMRILRGDLINNKNDELKEILTSEQFEKHKMLEEERAKEMRNGRRSERRER